MRTTDADIAEKHPQKNSFQIIALFLNEGRRGAGVAWQTKSDQADFAQGKKVSENPGDKVDPIFNRFQRRVKRANRHFADNRRQNAVQT